MILWKRYYGLPEFGASLNSDRLVAGKSIGNIVLHLGYVFIAISGSQIAPKIGIGIILSHTYTFCIHDA